MARLTVLQLYNRLMEMTGQSTVAALTGLAGLQLQSFRYLQQAIYDFYGEDLWRFAEQDNTITLSSATVSYAIPRLVRAVNKESFVNRHSNKKMKFTGWQRFIAEQKNWREAGKGVPGTVVARKRKFRLFPQANAAHHGSVVDYGYWERGSTLGTQSGSITGTIRGLPEEGEQAILSLAAYKVMTARGSPEALKHFNEYYGFKEGGETFDGHLGRVRRSYRSEELGDSIDMTYQF